MLIKALSAGAAQISNPKSTFDIQQKIHRFLLGQKYIDCLPLISHLLPFSPSFIFLFNFIIFLVMFFSSFFFPFLIEFF